VLGKGRTLAGEIVDYRMMNNRREGGWGNSTLCQDFAHCLSKTRPGGQRAGRRTEKTERNELFHKSAGKVVIREQVRVWPLSSGGGTGGRACAGGSEGKFKGPGLTTVVNQLKLEGAVGEDLKRTPAESGGRGGGKFNRRT